MAEEVEEEMEVDADVENQHIHSPRRKRPHQNVESHIDRKLKRPSVAVNETDSTTQEIGQCCIEVAGRIAGVELENFMCHGRLKVDFNTADNNCFYIGGPNGSGKSALFASLNIGLGGRGNDNDRGSSVKTYIKEGKSKARIRLILTNRGLGSHPDYGDFVVVERSITPSASTYVLKSIVGTGKNQRETTVSKKKADLDQLRIRYGIQLSNPIFWMSQDRSRHFLQQMRPDRLYKIFMHATELEHTKECYEKCEAIVASIEAMCKSMKGEFEKQKREYQSMVEERRRLRTIQEMRNQQSEIGWMLLWCPLRDVLEEIQVIEKKRCKFQEELDTIQRGIEESKTKREDCTTQTSVLRSRIEKKGNTLRSMREKMSSLKATISNLKSDIGVQDSKQKALETSRGSLEKRRDRLTEQIARFEEESQCEKRKEEIAVTKTKMDKINEKESEVLERYRSAQQERDELQKSYERASTSKDEAIREVRRISGKIKDVEQEIHRTEITSNNAMMRFGENIPRILEVMNANADKFEHLPKGPIGMHIKIRDRKWAFAIEEATRRLLTSFIFNSKRDHQVFERLMRSNRIGGALPNAIFVKFNIPPHNVTSNEPSSEWDTILRMIDVKDPVVRNVLIDMASAEGTILLRTDEDARRIMDGMCPERCIRAYTATGGMAMGRNRRGEGFYRFYACTRPQRTVLLADQVTGTDVDAMKTELTRLQHEQQRLHEEVKTASSEASRTQTELDKASQRHNAIEADLNRLRSQYRSLERALEQLELEDDYSVVDNMRASLNEINAQITELDGDFERLSQSALQRQRELSDVKKNYREVEAEFNEGKREMVDLETQEADVQEKIRRISVNIESDARRAARIQESFAKIDERIKELEAKKEEAEKTAERSQTLPTPSSMSNPPDMEQLPDTSDLDDQYKALTLKIESAEKVVGRTVTVEQLQSFKDNYEASKKHYLVLKSLNKKLSECLKIREEKFPIMCHAITMRLKMTFQRLMATRSYHGNLIVDRQKEVINISVATHLKDDNSQTVTKSVIQDLKGLSGGERSFTTACFIMALWEIMEAPFRCMDEFDVFMDMINRRVIMDLLVKLATEQYSHNQFIFFTPQGIKELGERERVQVFEMPKVRD
ncbi:hypothetical protein V3C99_010532 [Haemonchus contortus]